MVVSFGIALVLSAGLILGALIFLKRTIASAVGSDQERVGSEIKQVDERLAESVKQKDGFASKAQLDYLAGQVGALSQSLTQEKTSLVEIEKKLDAAQKNVEGKEAHQQEMKSAKEEDERKLQELLESFQNVSDEAVALEQRLAASLKNIDKMKEQLTLTNDQRAMIDNLSSTLENSGSRVRDLLMEYSSVNERLVQLTQQHTDLEEEYTKLVEQQLGE